MGYFKRHSDSDRDVGVDPVLKTYAKLMCIIKLIKYGRDISTPRTKRR
jgi:hypothetical protein